VFVSEGYGVSTVPMVLTGGGGKEVDILVGCIILTNNYIAQCKQVYNCNLNVSLVSLIVEIHIDRPLRPIIGVHLGFVIQEREADGKR
jgi:hypothetical protein